MNRVRTFLNLERGEEVPVFLLFSYLTLILTCYMITKAARDGIFLHKFSAMALPYVYIGIGVIIGFIVAIYIRLAARVSQVWLISGSLFFFATNILLLWWALRLEWKPAPWDLLCLDEHFRHHRHHPGLDSSQQRPRSPAGQENFPSHLKRRDFGRGRRRVDRRPARQVHRDG